ncbi:MAG TPA: hypothetical protein VIL37_16620 [Natronosporangium sp.]
MIDWWTAVRFLHVTGAALWVGGQLLLTLVVLPLARRALPAEQRATVLTAVGRRFGRLTLLAFLPLQVATGVALAVQAGVTPAELAEPGYERTLAAKLILVTVAMLASAGHGILARRRPVLARAAATFALVCSLGIVFLATALAS